MGLLSRIKKSLGGGDEAARKGDAASVKDPSATAVVQDLVLDAGDASEVLASLKEKVVELSNGQISAEGIDPNAILFDFGYVDSLSAVTLISFIDEKYQVSVSELDLVGSLNTLQAISDHIGRLITSE